MAGKSTYASGKPPESIAERSGFSEYTFTHGEWSYRDSYVGNTRSAGQEIVKFKDKIIWSNSYCGGMTAGSEPKANDTYQFLKEALSQDDESLDSLRGPKRYQQNDWLYTYSQEGDISNFSGYEEIYHKGVLVFFHRAIGGVIA